MHYIIPTVEEMRKRDFEDGDHVYFNKTKFVVKKDGWGIMFYYQIFFHDGQQESCCSQLDFSFSKVIR